MISSFSATMLSGTVEQWNSEDAFKMVSVAPGSLQDGFNSQVVLYSLQRGQYSDTMMMSLSLP
jgi:hypothetical protein